MLRWEDHRVAPPGPGEARVRHTAIAVNYSDINVRRGGFYIARPLRFPLILGNEAAGVVASVGPDVTDVQPGDRVAYAGMRGEFFEDTGAYAQERNVPAERLIKLPEGVSDQQAAGMMVKGLTASLIINHVYRPKPGDTILIHAAASGVGLILTQWAKHLGATVIGTVGSPRRPRSRRAHGCDHTILYRETDFVDAVKQIVPQGVSAVFDGVGKDTFMASLALRAAVRHAGELRQRLGPSAAARSAAARQGRLAVGLPPGAVSSLTARRRAHARGGGGTVRPGARGVLRIEIGRTYALTRRRGGAPRRRAQVAGRLDGAAAVRPAG